MLNRTKFNLIPLRDNSKLPAINWNEFKTKRYEGPIYKNYAVICGKVSSCVVIDLDSPELTKEIFDDFEKIKKKTLVVETGKGFHVYVKPKNGVYPQKTPLTNPKGQHIDIQSTGSYVVGPGSIHPSGKEYKIVSSTTEIDEIDLEGFTKSLMKFGFNTEYGGLLPFHEIAQGKLKQGERNNHAFKYAIMMFEDKKLNADTVWFELQNWNKTLQPPLPENELKTVFNSALKKHMSKVQPEIKEYVIAKRIRQISAQEDEGEQISFTCFIASIDEHRTIAKKVECFCIDCDKDEVSVSDGFYNAPKPKCPICKNRMKYKEILESEDTRTIVLQELPEEVENNSPIRKIARLHGEVSRLVCISSRKVLVTGIFKSVEVRSERENEIIIEVSRLEYLDDDVDELPDKEELKSFDIENLEDKLITSFAPYIYGYEDIKKTLLLFRVGGGNIRRKDIHICLIGNPSKGKSELMKFFGKIANSCYVNGKLASGAGLAAGMVKLPTGNSVPHMGVLTLYDFVCIDEFDKSRKEDRGACLESMEQRTVTLNKAGVSQTVPSPACILAAANPQYGKWDSNLGLTQNINIESYLLSRFDIIWGMISESSMQRARVAHHIIANTLQDTGNIYNENQLRKYFNYCSILEPKLSLEAGKHLESFFIKTAEFVEENNTETLPMDIRQLEGLVRLATANAKLLRKKDVDIDDANEAIRLYKASLMSFGLNVDEGFTQLNLLSPAENKEQAFLHAVQIVKNKEGNFRHDDVVKAMAKMKFFKTVDKANKYLAEQLENSKILTNDDASYRLFNK